MTQELVCYGKEEVGYDTEGYDTRGVCYGEEGVCYGHLLNG